LKEGVTIHKDFEDWFESPECGLKKEITLTYDTDKVVSVIIRRLNNKAKHVQIKYDTTKHLPFREWLNNIFSASKEQTIGEILEFHKMSKDEYTLKPLTREMIDGMNLRISKTLYHGGAQNIIPHIPIFKEILEIVSQVDFRVGRTQIYYNQQLKERFIRKGWEVDKPVIENLNLKYDYRKANVQIEAEFGNARSYYQDYLKFSIAFNEGLISLGALVTPTADFANILCEIGREKATQKVHRQGRGDPTYSGMMTYEKAAKEFKYLKFMLNMPIVVMGIDYKE